jgi:hypothetical protein
LIALAVVLTGTARSRAAAAAGEKPRAARPARKRSTSSCRRGSELDHYTASQQTYADPDNLVPAMARYRDIAGSCSVGDVPSQGF